VPLRSSAQRGIDLTKHVLWICSAGIPVGSCQLAGLRGVPTSTVREAVEPINGKLGQYKAYQCPSCIHCVVVVCHLIRCGKDLALAAFLSRRTGCSRSRADTAQLKLSSSETAFAINAGARVLSIYSLTVRSVQYHQ
jgi:hypothetical protein